MEEQIQTGKKELSSLGIKDLFYKYIRFLPLFIICIALSLFVAYIYLRYATMTYTSTGSLVIQDDKSSNNASSDKFDQLFASDGIKNIQNELEYLRSRPLMGRVVEALNLNFTYFAKGNIKELNVYKDCPFKVEAFKINDSSSSFILKIDFENQHNFKVNGQGSFSYGQMFSNESGIFRLTQKPGSVAGSQYKLKWEPTNVVASSLVGNLAVAPKPNTGILILSLESSNDRLSADVINELMEKYQEGTKEDKNLTTRQKLAFIDERMDTVAAQLNAIRLRRLQLINRLNLVNPQAQSNIYFNQIENTTTQLKEQEGRLKLTFHIEDDLRDNASSISTPSSLGLEDPVLNALAANYNQVQIERKVLLKNAPPGNIAVKQNEEVLNSLKQKLQENLHNIRASINTSIGSLRKTSSEAGEQIRLMPSKQQALLEIEGELESKEAVYNRLLGLREESAIALASTISNIKVLQDATPNPNPVKPNRRNTQILAILIGLVLPALFIFVLELLNDKVTTRYDIERMTTATIIGEVGHSYGKNTLVVTNNNRSVVAEQFRIVRSNLQYVMNNLKKPVVLVTSSFSGEGKSFVSTNVGAVMALAGKKTIILEFDIRKPKILSQLNIPKKPGLTNYLLGKLNVENLAVPVEGSENLFVLPCGPVPPNPAELLLDVKLIELFAYLKENFDVIIMDTAPVGMVSDALTLSKFADCTLYIVRQGHTYKKQIGLIDEFYRENKLPKISLILNDVKLRSGYGYYGYGRYGYGYGYGSGYFEEEEAPPPTFLRKWFGWLDINTWSKKKKRKTNKA